MTAFSVSKDIQSPDDMADMARKIAAHLSAGDCLLLEGIIGAGKSHFARNLIQSLLPQPEDIPSPTFTLVQTYDGPDCEIWHSDLYRLSSLDEVFELGLVEAFDSEITLVEWPEKLEDVAPPHALRLKIDLNDTVEDVRTVTFEWSDPKWTPLLENLSHD
ncbi:tRNA (adenosine(37)-N6)-threonylcarbamoyltransferase complex ATPase subunit type 1 TsaE [Epibacterium ulvae]|uniref:tRNA (adenosine(37)-N6)-threonylcarbamoyltransferase complex ATPase subunit type 1 TsaE n=1 Tax=Epibacterium ulvae TaxID=1156985 RepID=UPI001BFBFD07|nr:tRNA (adenosine(37)-N6)-threonylcarbamoyltransferase complex ATPase subunit type 1 TsaE [Epibacterium ulvae]MBT8153621.1 tRNA (adenosine(37)-N6)-threonylcarbamoyltransferase complex ATPase subunit type 1 TsaE [Epibacterium ulvae]